MEAQPKGCSRAGNSEAQTSIRDGACRRLMGASSLDARIRTGHKVTILHRVNNHVHWHSVDASGPPGAWSMCCWPCRRVY